MPTIFNNGKQSTYPVGIPFQYEFIFKSIQGTTHLPSSAWTCESRHIDCTSPCDELLLVSLWLAKFKNRSFFLRFEWKNLPKWKKLTSTMTHVIRWAWNVNPIFASIKINDKIELIWAARMRWRNGWCVMRGNTSPPKILCGEQYLLVSCGFACELVHAIRTATRARIRLRHANWPKCFAELFYIEKIIALLCDTPSRTNLVYEQKQFVLSAPNAHERDRSLFGNTYFVCFMVESPDHQI